LLIIHKRFYLHGLCSINQTRLYTVPLLVDVLLIRVALFTNILLLLIGLETSNRRAQKLKIVLDALASRKQPLGR